MLVEIPQDEARRLWLQMVRGDGALLELRHKRPHGTMRRGFFDAHAVDRLVAVIERLAPIADVYLGAAPRAREDGTANGVARGHCLWADCDTPESVARLADFDPAPSIFVRTGSGGGHAYWQLNRPLAPRDLHRANRRIAVALGADLAATDPARILRPPGTLNHKTPPPRPVVCTRLETTSFSAAEVVGGLADSHHYAAPDLRAATATGYATGDAVRLLEGLVRTVREAPVGQRNSRLHWSVCRVADHADSGALDEHQAVAAIRAAAIDVGLSEFEIDATIRSGLGRRAARVAA
jgi:hypothetical protein